MFSYLSHRNHVNFSNKDVQDVIDQLLSYLSWWEISNIRGKQLENLIQNDIIILMTNLTQISIL